MAANPQDDFDFDPIPDPDAAIIPFDKLTRDIKAAAEELTKPQARFFVDMYYGVQAERIRTSNQVRAASERPDNIPEEEWEPEPNEMLTWMTQQQGFLENNLRTVLNTWSDRYVVGRWAKSQHGIGPVLGAGLLAHIDTQFTTSVSKLWRFAGLDPTSTWIGKEGAKEIVKELLGKETKAPKGGFPYDLVAQAAILANRPPQSIFRLAGMYDKKRDQPVTRESLTMALARRPWNARLKVLCWKMGQSFMKTHNSPNAFYGHIYADRKRLEVERNLAGMFRDQADLAIETRKIGSGTATYKWYSGSLTPEMAAQIAAAPAERREGLTLKLAGKPGSGVAMLPPARIDLRAQRIPVKLFLSHYWEVAWMENTGQSGIEPWIIQYGDHHDLIPVPGWPFDK